MRIIKVQRILDDSELSIRVDFEKNNKKAYFTYTLIGRDIGVDECNYEEENVNENIYSLIQDWVDNNISTETKVLYDGEEVKL